MKYNQQIRAKKVRLIGIDGKQIGVVTIQEALSLAQEEGVDLVEVVPDVDPPVCKVIDYGKFRYDQTKRKKEGKKGQHQVKVKEIKFKPNIDVHDLDFKMKRAREFLEKGDKVRIVCAFRGREILHKEVGEKVVESFLSQLQDIGTVEAQPKLLGKTMTAVVAPSGAVVVKKKLGEKGEDCA